MNVYFESNPQGLWMGIIVALIMQALFLWIITLCTDWEKEVTYFDTKSHIYHRLFISSDGLLFSFFCRLRKLLREYIRIFLEMHYHKAS